MAKFEDSIKVLRAIEGNYVNDPTDHGGETYCGISRKNFPDWKGWARIDSIKSSAGFPGILNLDMPLFYMVNDFYREEFWDRNELTAVDDQEIADEIFEMAINLGNKPAIKILQKALNLLNKKEKLYKNISVDGLVGRTTLSLVNSFKEKREALINTINGYQFAYYANICENDETQERFFYGWLNRTK